MTPKKQQHTPGDRFTVMHNETSKERLSFIKDVLGLSNTSQVVHMAIQQYYRAVKLEEDSRTVNRVSKVG